MSKTTIVIGQNENHTIHASASAMTRRLDVVVDNTPVFSQVLPLGQSAKIQVGYTETHDVELRIGSWWKVHIWVDGVKKA